VKEEYKYITEYIKEIDKLYKLRMSKELGYRSSLQKLFKNITGIEPINEPDIIECGKPDLLIQKDEISIGYIETKNINADFNNKTNKEQINRYKESLSNIIVTDYIIFLYYRDNEYITSINIGKEVDGKIIENKIDYDKFLEMIKIFTKYEGIKINNSEKLAKIMANKTRFLKKIIKEIFVVYKDKENSIKEQMNIFKEYLIHDLDENKFSDIYSQTIAYGLFAAKLYDKSGYKMSRFSVSELIPQSNPFLKRFFHYIMGPDIDENIKWFVDDFAEFFNKVDIEKIKDEFENKKQDPYIYFYETFLDEYDKKQKKEMGAYYTPIPVVKFIINSVDEILKKEFELEEGIADSSKIHLPIKYEDGKIKQQPYPKVQILDPATGTGTFLSEIIDKVYNIFKNENKGMWQEYCENYLIPRIYGFEYLMASYTIAHLKIDMKLKETGYYKKNWEYRRLGIYLTNTLEEFDKNIKELALLKWLSDEAKEARIIKSETPVMIVLGNPPYNVKSKNSFEDDIYLSYKKEPGGIENLDEKNMNNLNDDYVKFIGYGHSLINKNKEGILAYINNNGFLDNSTFRGMRWSLLNTFDKIYIINLHGDVEKNKDSGDKEDENVFNIKKGVSINIFIKNNKKKENELANVYYAEIRGNKNIKYDFLLDSNNIYNIKLENIKIKEPYYYLSPKLYENENKYNEYFGIQELFNVYSSGTQTGRDHFTINENKEILINNINEFLSLDDEKARERFDLGEDTGEWKIKYAKKDLISNTLINNNFDYDKIIKIQYRPFDIRYTYFTGNSKGFHRRPAGKIMRHFIIGSNIGLIFKRGLVGNAPTVFVTNTINNLRSWSRTGMIGDDYIAPLYIYPFENDKEKHINLNSEILSRIEGITKLKFVDKNIDDDKTFEPIDVLDYIYAVLHSNIYREKYNEQLKTDFPRIKYPKDAEEFKSLKKYGIKLRKLHLMEKNIEVKNNINYPVDGNNEIGKIYYEDEKIYINETQYFEKISVEIWDYFVGGYRPAYQWLKERKGKNLNYENIKHFKNIIYVLSETIEIQKEIDKIMKITNW
jgi:predicted helicase